MFKIDNQSRIAVYEQIVVQVKKYVMTGILQAEAKMPSVRKMSVELNVNPNTVQRAYTELERAGVIVTSPGRGAFVSQTGQAVLQEERKITAIKKLETVLNDLKVSHVAKKQVLDIVDEIYEGGISSD